MNAKEMLETVIAHRRSRLITIRVQIKRMEEAAAAELYYINKAKRELYTIEQKAARND